MGILWKLEIGMKAFVQCVPRRPRSAASTLLCRYLNLYLPFMGLQHNQHAASPSHTCWTGLSSAAVVRYGHRDSGLDYMPFSGAWGWGL